MAAAKKKAAKIEPVGEPRLERVALTELLKRRAPWNPKKHALDLIGDSYREHGAVETPGIDEKSGFLFAGHGRVEELAAMKEAGEPPPARVLDKDGEWFVWTMRGMSFKNLRQLKKYVLTQRIGEIGGYDNAAMGKILAELDGDLVGTGVREKELVSFLAKVGEPAIPEIKSTYSIVVECKGEKQQVQLLKRFQAMGLKTRAIVT